MNPTQLLTSFCRSVEAGDGAAFAALFTVDGVYHDVFYGAFAGRERIAAMLTDWFHRDATDFRWDMLEPICDGTTLYARYVFSFTSRLPDAAGRRAMFEGVSIMTLRDGLIATYREVANPGPGLVDLGFAPERIARLFARDGAALRARPEAERHLAGEPDRPRAMTDSGD
jgi:ketosteroid isomerase-like protein